MQLVPSRPNSKPVPESIGGLKAAISQNDLRAVVEQISVPRVTGTAENEAVRRSDRLKAFPPDEWHEYRVLAEGNHQRHWIDGHQTVDVIDLDEKGRKLDGVLAVQVHVGPPMTIQYKDVLLKVLAGDLPLLTLEHALNPYTIKVVRSGKRLKTACRI